jgi:hypothetical protein
MSTESTGAQECPAKPLPEHQWLDKLVGEWDTSADCNMGPDQEPFKGKGHETVRSIGGLWVVAEGKGEMPGGGTAHMVLTLGYDPEKKRYVGTWIGSMMTILWVYDGELEADGKTLSLYAKGPNMTETGFGQGTALYRERITFVTDDHRTWTSAVQGEDGQWNHIMQADYRRKN